jgi:anti-anti-sigma factor
MIQIERREDGTLAFSGRLDASQAEAADAALSEAEGGVVVDIADLEYISSAGIGILLKHYKRLSEAGGSLRLAHATPHVRNVFHFAGLDQLLGLT